MKRIIFLTGAFLLFSGASGLRAQHFFNVFNMNEVLKTEPVDETMFTVQYDTRVVGDTLKPDKAFQETMMLKVGKSCSVYYSYARFLTDSIVEADKAAGASIEVIQEHLKQFRSKINYKIYKNHPAGKVTTLDQIAMNRFRCEEANETQAWELTEETDTVIGYPCRKAVCHFRGRDYEAWFAPEIARSEGPWKLHGLPGLILKARDTQGHYTFEATGLVMNRDKDAIAYGDQGYEPISRKNLNKMHERFAADPIGYSTSAAPNVKIVIKGEGGQPQAPKNLPYNPIER